MSFWFWNGASLSSALVDSALAGSQDDAWLSWTSVSLPATERTGGHHDEDPEPEHEPLGDASGELAGDLSVHAASPAERTDRRHRGLPRVREALSES